MKNMIKYVSMILFPLFCIVLFTGCGKAGDPGAVDLSKVYRWKLQAQSPAQNPDYISLQRFSENIKKMSHGRLLITPYPAGIITRGEGIFDGVKNRVTEMGMGWPNWWLGKDPAWSFLQAGPFGFMTIEESMIYFYEDEGMKIANDLTRPHGILWRPAWWAGMEFGILTTFPARGLNDLKGKKIRMGPGLPYETLAKAAGCYTVPIVPEEIYDALKNKVIDGVEWTVPGATWSMKFHEVCTHIISPAIWQPSVLGDFLINREAYNELPEDLQTILEVAIREYALYTTIHGKALDMEALKKYKEHGMVIQKWSPGDIARWKAAAKEIYARYRASSPSFKRVYDSKMRFKKKYREYNELFKPYE
ncbi:MAG: hypothetical protein GY754_29445 [bacterium]|nr:hypothetical protein [bacterium]